MPVQRLAEQGGVVPPHADRAQSLVQEHQQGPVSGAGGNPLGFDVDGAAGPVHAAKGGGVHGFFLRWVTAHRMHSMRPSGSRSTVWPVPSCIWVLNASGFTGVSG